MDQQVDVVVVGAGPVGLLTAIELTLGGARVLVLERLAAASLDMKAGGLGPLGLEALERRGMAAAIAAAEARSFAAMAQAGADPRSPSSSPANCPSVKVSRRVLGDRQKEPKLRVGFEEISAKPVCRHPSGSTALHLPARS
jgi:2-polyprenyl-6-methoxyphenol hydroxylase-like FAD-dependent oxidoreductase